ncbi:tho complex subunit 2, partial [Plakobranchus ocellatus]
MATVCLTDDILRSWDKSGRSEFAKLCKSLNESDGSIKLLPKKCLKRALYELCNAVQHNKLRIDNAVSLLVDLKDCLPSVPSTLADVLGIVDVETNCLEEPLREKFLSLVAAVR